MMATVPHVTSGLGLRKFQADGFLLTRVYVHSYAYPFAVADLSFQYRHPVSLMETGILDHWIQSKAVRIRCCITV